MTKSSHSNKKDLTKNEKIGKQWGKNGNGYKQVIHKDK